MQGFACDTDPAVAQVAPWLRLTPAVTFVWIVTALVLRSASALWIFAGLAALGAGGLHLLDQTVNVVLRARGAPTLPANPAPRRFAMALAAGMSAASGLLIARGYTTAGVLLGSVLAVAALLVATTHFCLGSWMWAQLRRGVGALTLPLIAILVVLSGGASTVYGQRIATPARVPAARSDVALLTWRWPADSGQGRATYWLEGAVVGGAVIGFLGTVTGLGLCHFDDPCPNPAPFAIGGFLLGALAGVGLGGHIGANFPKHRYRSGP